MDKTCCGRVTLAKMMVPCVSHGTGKNEVAIHSTSCEPFLRASPSATEVPLEPYSTLNGMTKSHFPHEIMKSAYVKCLFYTRQVNPVCKIRCFTHDPAKIGVPVCKNPTFTHGKLAPCVKRPLLLTANESRMQNPVFYTRHWKK